MNKYAMFPDVYLQRLYYIICRINWLFIMTEVERWESSAIDQAKQRLDYWNAK